MRQARACVLGAGAWGTCLADALACNGHRVSLWARDAAVARQIRGDRRNEKYLPGARLAPGLEATAEMEEALRDARVVVSVVPSHGVRSVMQEAARHLDRPLLISATKGIETHSGLRMSQVLEEVVGEELARGVVVLSGPSFASELARRLPTAVVAASTDLENGRAVQALFQNDYFRIYTQSDVIGTELGGALITRGQAEMVRLAVRLGAQEATLAGLAGIGDLVLTCTGNQSRNRRVGLAIGSGRPPSEVLAEMQSVVEGFRTAQAARDLAGVHQVEMPIVNAVYSILYEELGPREALAALMAREPKPERWS